MKNSLDYYNENATTFIKRTINRDVSPLYKKFLRQIPKNSHILDAGCGSGRDSHFFQEQGFGITAFDASKEMTKFSSELIGKPVLKMRFQDINFSEEFDAVWASASLIHVPYDQQQYVMKRIHRSLKPSGIFFASYKHGQTQRKADDRFFFDMDETTIHKYTDGLFEIIELWDSPDIKNKPSASPTSKWLNILCRKKHR